MGTCCMRGRWKPKATSTKALEEYKALAPGYPGAEAAVRYAQLLKAQGQQRRVAQG